LSGLSSGFFRDGRGKVVWEDFEGIVESDDKELLWATFTKRSEE
jgi:hypothetical protein